MAAVALAEGTLEGAPKGFGWWTLALALLHAAISVTSTLWLVAWSQRWLTSQRLTLQRAGRAPYATYFLHPLVLTLIMGAFASVALGSELKFLLPGEEPSVRRGNLRHRRPDLRRPAVNLLALPRPRVVDRRTQFDPHTIPDPGLPVRAGQSGLRGGVRTVASGPAVLCPVAQDAARHRRLSSRRRWDSAHGPGAASAPSRATSRIIPGCRGHGAEAECQDQDPRLIAGQQTLTARTSNHSIARNPEQGATAVETAPGGRGTACPERRVVGRARPSRAAGRRPGSRECP